MSSKNANRLSVSVIIPVHNGGQKFQECLTSVSRLDPSPVEVIVVSDGSTDASAELAETHEAKVVRLPEARGPARARNRGAAAACGEILFFVDADVTLPPDALARLTSRFSDSPDVSAIIGSYDDEPAARGFIAQYKNLFHHYTHQMGNEEATTFWGACGAIRRDIFLELGGFDESYERPSIEDIELGYRMYRAGGRIFLDKDLQVKHLKAWNFRSLVKTDFLERALPWTELILRDRHFPKDLNLRRSTRASVLLTFGSFVGLLAFVWPPAAWLAAGQLGLLLLINAPVYSFFARKRGLRFALCVIFLHFLYHLSCGLAFAIGLARHLVNAGARTGRDPRRRASQQDPHVDEHAS